MSFFSLDEYNEKQRKLRQEEEEIQNITNSMTLDKFVDAYSSKRLTKKIALIAKKAEIVIAVYTGHAIFMEGGIEHGIDLYEEDKVLEDMLPEEINKYLKEREKKFRGNDYYFDKIGFFNPFSHFKSIEKWEEFLKIAKTRFLKMSYNTWDERFECNFNYLPFQYTCGLLGNAQSIVFKVPQFTETSLKDFVYLPIIKKKKYI